MKLDLYGISMFISYMCSIQIFEMVVSHVIPGHTFKMLNVIIGLSNSLILNLCDNKN